MRLFAYGTLMWPEILQAVAGVSAGGTTATLHGFSRLAVHGEAYPGIVPEPLGRVEGVLYSSLPPHCLARLDRFEGPEYQREQRLLVTADGRRLQAWCYVFRPECRGLLEPTAWDPGRFRQRDLDRYLVALKSGQAPG